MANTAALPLSPPLSPPMTFRNKKRRLQWDMGEYQDSMASESCVPLLSAADSQGMMISCGDPAFPGFLGFEGALLNGELQLQNDLTGVFPLTSNGEGPFDLVDTGIPYPGGINAPVAPEMNINPDQDQFFPNRNAEESTLAGAQRRQMGFHFQSTRRTTAAAAGQQQSGLNPNNQDNQNKQYKRRKSHNLVERRYRVNLNGKFRKLEEVVLQGTASPCASSPCSPQQTPSPRMPSTPQKSRSKARILDGALTYIADLENEVSALKQRLAVSTAGLAEVKSCVDGPEIKVE